MPSSPWLSSRRMSYCNVFLTGSCRLSWTERSWLAGHVRLGSTLWALNIFQEHSANSPAMVRISALSSPSLAHSGLAQELWFCPLALGKHSIQSRKPSGRTKRLHTCAHMQLAESTSLLRYLSQIRGNACSVHLFQCQALHCLLQSSAV